MSDTKQSREWRGKPRQVVAPYIDRHGTTILFGDASWNC